MPEELLPGAILRRQGQNQLGTQNFIYWGPPVAMWNSESWYADWMQRFQVRAGISVFLVIWAGICIAEKCLWVIKNLLVMADTCIYFSIQAQRSITPECHDITFWGELRIEGGREILMTWIASSCHSWILAFKWFLSSSSSTIFSKFRSS